MSSLFFCRSVFIWYYFDKCTVIFYINDMCSISDLFLNLGVYANYIFIPPVAILLILGFLVLFADHKKISNRVYFLIIIFLIIWITSDFLSYKISSPMGVLWADRISSLGIVAGALSILFIYVFPEKEKVSVKILSLIFIPLIPFLAMVPTSLYETVGPAPDCASLGGPAYFVMVGLLSYYIILGVSFLLIKFKRLDENQKKQLEIFTAGSFLTIFLGIIIDVLPSILNDNTVTLFTPYATLAFAGLGAYAIVKYKALSSKIIAAQALVFFLVILTGSQLFYVTNLGNRIIAVITVIITAVLGLILIKSVKKEIEQKEALEIANREISERKDQLQAMSDSLALANDKLRQLDQAKTDFVSLASHQLRRSPTAIKGFISLILEGSYGKINAAVKDVLEKVYKSNEVQIAFVEDLLNISRLESGRLKFEFAASAVEELCQDAVDALALKATDAGLYLDYKKPKKPLPHLMMDKSKIREAISNLVDNAVKYTKKGGVTLMVELCSRQSDLCLSEKHARITISDTGIGIPATEIPYLFSKFSRGKDISRLDANGTGLGLYMVKMMAEGHGGKVWVESAGDGKGSRFMLELPIEQSSETLAKYA